jgi:hypothetical protein
MHYIDVNMNMKFQKAHWMVMAFCAVLQSQKGQCQKRPTIVSKETYYSVKRDLLQCQKALQIAYKMPH